LLYPTHKETPDGLVDTTYVDIYMTLLWSSPHAVLNGRVHENSLVYDTAAGAVMLKIAIAEIDRSKNIKRYFLVAIYKLVKVVYIYQNRTKYDFLPPSQPKAVKTI